MQTKFEVGTRVVLVVKYNSPLLDNVFTNIPKTQTFRGEVLPSTDYDPLDSVRITSDDPMVDLRVVMLRNVVSCNGEPFAFSPKKAEPKKPEYVIVQGSGDKVYTVTRKGDGSLSCSCPGFGFRGRCKHVEQVKA